MSEAVCRAGSMLEAVSEEKKDEVLRDIGLDRMMLERDVQSVRDWLKKQPHLPPVDSDELIKSFIIGCKGNLEGVKKKLDAYYSVRTQIPVLFSNRDPKEEIFQRYVRTNPIMTLPKLTEDGCRVHIILMTGPDPKHYDILSAAKRVLSLIEISLRTEAHTNGVYILVSCKYAHFGHLTMLTPTQVRNGFFLYEKAFPIRLKKFYIFNSTPVIDIVVNKIIKPFLKKAIFERIIVTREDHQFLHKHFKKEILPKDFGGDEVDLNTLRDMWLNKIMEMREWFIAESQLVTNEELRPKESKRETLLGLIGTFKHLIMD